jgi:antitoxin VapB
MAEYARLFRNGGSQAVRLPREHRFPGDRVRITRVPGGGVLLQPVHSDPEAWFAATDAAGRDVPFMEGERDQPPPQERRGLDDEDAGAADAGGTPR